jgi:hypothetical protein
MARPPRNQFNATERTLLEYGKAMSEWSRIERALFHWFAHVTLLDDEPARRIFYSTTGFRGRADMLSAVVSLNKLEANETELIKVALKRAVQWSAFRNKLAHGEFSLDRQNIVQGKLSPHIARSQAISFEHLKRAQSNFRQLSEALYAGLELAFGPYDGDQDDPLSSLEKCIELVRSLPVHLEPDR